MRVRSLGSGFGAKLKGSEIGLAVWDEVGGLRTGLGVGVRVWS